MVKSQMPASRPPLAPVRAADFTPRLSQSSAAFARFLALPDVEMNSATSPGFARPYSVCATEYSPSTSLANAVGSASPLDSDIAGSAPWSFSASSFGILGSDTGRGSLKPFISSPTICSASAALPPFPAHMSLPP